MTRTLHFLYILFFVFVILLTLAFLTYKGFSYYKTSQEERFYNPQYNALKPSGSVGHGLGIAGSLFIIIGVFTYMARKRYRFLSHLGLLKYWLEFHIFMCILGTLLVVFHTSFKIGGVAAVSFWSMIVVFTSGIAGRVIYLQIPRTIEGRELDQRETRDLRNSIIDEIRGSYGLNEESLNFINSTAESLSGSYRESPSINFVRRYHDNRNSVRAIRGTLRENNLSRHESSKIISLVRDDIRLGRRIGRLETMKNLFHYWHIFHLPFAILMLIFLVMHVIVTVALGYKWIF
jgi:hypothetical protein